MTPDLIAAADRLLRACRQRRVMLATAESCTGGLIAALLTEVAGSSDVVERGFVTYSNAAKTSLLGVPEALLAVHGAVSEPVARAMAEGVLAAAPACGLALAVTGIAGPSGGSAEKPIGLVHGAAARREGGLVLHRRQVFAGDRGAIRRAAALAALELGVEILGHDRSVSNREVQDRS